MAYANEKWTLRVFGFYNVRAATFNVSLFGLIDWKGLFTTIINELSKNEVNIISKVGILLM